MSYLFYSNKMKYYRGIKWDCGGGVQSSGKNRNAPIQKLKILEE